MPNRGKNPNAQCQESGEYWRGWLFLMWWKYSISWSGCWWWGCIPLRFIILHLRFVCFSFFSSCQILDVQLLSCVWLFAVPWTAAYQASLSFTVSQRLLKLMSIESMMPLNFYPLLPPSPPALNLSQHDGLFQWVGSSSQVSKGLELQLQHQSFQWLFRVDFL